MLFNLPKNVFGSLRRRKSRTESPNNTASHILQSLNSSLRRSGHYPFEPFTHSNVTETATAFVVWIQTPPTSRIEQVAEYVGQYSMSCWRSMVQPPLKSDKIIQRWISELRQWQHLAPMLLLADAKAIPYQLFWNDGLPRVIFGQGSDVHTSAGLVTDIDSAFSWFVCADKAKCKEFLSDSNVPTPNWRVVRTQKETLEATEAIRFPVVLKPAAASNGFGVVTNIRTMQHLRSAFKLLSRTSRQSRYVVEKHVIGRYFRALVIDGQFKRLAEGRPRIVKGDDRTRLAVIIKLAFPNLFRVPYLKTRLRHTLAAENLKLSDIPGRGRMITITPPTGQWIDRTEEISECNVKILEGVGKALSPAILGFDILASNTRDSFLESGAQVIEVNPSPGLWFHKDPGELAELWLRRLYPTGYGGVRLITVPDHLKMEPSSADYAVNRSTIYQSARLLFFPMTMDDAADPNFSFGYSDGSIVTSATPSLLRVALFWVVKSFGLVLTDADFVLTDQEAIISRKNELRVRVGAIA